MILMSSKGQGCWRNGAHTDMGPHLSCGPCLSLRAVLENVSWMHHELHGAGGAISFQSRRGGVRGSRLLGYVASGAEGCMVRNNWWPPRECVLHKGQTEGWWRTRRSRLHSWAGARTEEITSLYNYNKNWCLGSAAPSWALRQAL